MKNKRIFIIGIIITILIAYLSSFTGKLIDLRIDFFPNSFITHSAMLLLSISAMLLLKKYLNYHISIPKFKSIIKPFILGFLVSIIGNMITMSIIMNTSGTDSTRLNMPTANMTVLQIFIFVFIYASLAEEMLYRGFLQNSLAPIKEKGIKLLNRKISIPVIVSAILFGLSHLILLNPDRNNYFVIGIVINATLLGFVAGYYQEKYNNNAHAIIVHMSANLMALIGVFILNR